LLQQWHFHTHMRQRQTCRLWSHCRRELKTRATVVAEVNAGVAARK
jgi:hypothetical protein